MIFIFPKESNTDWNRIRQVTKSWPDPPLLIYKDMSDKYPDAFDGYYAWVQPGKDGWARDGSNYGEDYLNYFYRNMQEHHPDKIAVGAVWPGFDDSKASWSRNRHIAYRCGKTFEDVLRVFRKYYGSQNAAPYLLVETWNDYEEGTDVERSIGHCGGNSTLSSMGAGRAVEWRSFLRRSQGANEHGPGNQVERENFYAGIGDRRSRICGIASLRCAAGEGNHVVCVDNLLTGSLRNIAHLKNEPRFEFVQTRRE